jgi:hypothetical protein
MRSRALNVVVAMLLVCGFTRPQDAWGEPDWRSLVVADGPTAESERQALVAAIRVMPRLPARVAVIDANDAAPEVKSTLLQLDTFITRGSPVVYVLRHSPVLQGARTGSSISWRSAPRFGMRLRTSKGPTSAALESENSRCGQPSSVISASINSRRFATCRPCRSALTTN